MPIDVLQGSKHGAKQRNVDISETAEQVNTSKIARDKADGSLSDHRIQSRQPQQIGGELNGPRRLQNRLEIYPLDTVNIQFNGCVHYHRRHRHHHHPLIALAKVKLSVYAYEDAIASQHEAPRQTLNRYLRSPGLRAGLAALADVRTLRPTYLIVHTFKFAHALM
ncbi:predicted protein [Histoplasma capsulatum G186AR]|uniref:Uncharacterized protein n=1 Tax=Ajellomyces capsulatus (strain G186AR / H82 / ATCC MYA-2454 / RMSCC 2432) TaxID=447093 RepID=C0NCG9_AJECG|nr:uncharacterized protein HCBG_00815 [Histoplasma capsulatum G186AR]EEH11360.1 predicted protein [Histoplasma capsulatum G186AR]